MDGRINKIGRLIRIWIYHLETESAWNILLTSNTKYCYISSNLERKISTLFVFLVFVKRSYLNPDWKESGSLGSGPGFVHWRSTTLGKNMVIWFNFALSVLIRIHKKSLLSKVQKFSCHIRYLLIGVLRTFKLLEKPPALEREHTSLLNMECL